MKGTHPAGHVLLRWEANAQLGEDEESESWMGLLPSKWNTDQVYAWRRDIRTMVCGRTRPVRPHECIVYLYLLYMLSMIATFVAHQIDYLRCDFCGASIIYQKN